MAEVGIYPFEGDAMRHRSKPLLSFSILALALGLAGCGANPTGKPLDLGAARHLVVGQSRLPDVRSTMGQPFLANPVPARWAGACPNPSVPSERWVYSYEDTKKNSCSVTLTFDERQTLCAMQTVASRPGPLCMGARP
jgi:hypothetical protein